MKTINRTITTMMEFQIDEKPNGGVIRLNFDGVCALRICQIPKEVLVDEKGTIRPFIDIVFGDVTYRAKQGKPSFSLKTLVKVHDEIQKEFGISPPINIKTFNYEKELHLSIIDINLTVEEVNTLTPITRSVINSLKEKYKEKEV